MMGSDDKKVKTTPEAKATPAPKKEAPAESKSAATAEPAKSDSAETAVASPASYSRGEGQKPVTKAYKDNWNAIFAKKDSPRKKRR
jgi:hypothetical protein